MIEHILLTQLVLPVCIQCEVELSREIGKVFQCVGSLAGVIKFHSNSKTQWRRFPLLLITAEHILWLRTAP